MGKKRRRKKEREERKKKPPQGSSPQAAVPVEDEKDAITSAGKKTIVAGIALLIAGFVILTLTDPEGRNWASTLSPLMILGAYGVIAYGIFQPDTAPPTPPAEEETK